MHDQHDRTLKNTKTRKTIKRKQNKLYVFLTKDYFISL